MLSVYRIVGSPLFVAGLCLLSATCKAEGSGSGEEVGDIKIDVAPNAMRLPLGRIMLVRQGKQYGAVKFLVFQVGKTKEDWLLDYEAYDYGAIGAGSVSAPRTKRGQLSSSKPRGIGRFAFSFGEKDLVFGAFRLAWTSNGWLYFYNSTQGEGDYGVELAPTPWDDISKVDLFDRRLHWLRYDKERKRSTYSIDQFWKQ